MRFPLALSLAAIAAATSLPASAAVRSIPDAVRTRTSVTLPAGATTLTQAFPAAYVRMGAAAPANAPMRVTVSLVTRNDALVNRILARQNTPGDTMYHHYLTPQQTFALASPSNAQVGAVEAYLASNGFTHIVATPDNELVAATGTVGAANAAFGSAEHTALFGTKTVLVNTAPATVPPQLVGTVRAVLGLSTVPSHTDIRYKSAGASCVLNPANNVCTLNDFGPRDLWYAYDTAGYAIQGRGFTADFRNGIDTSIGIFAEGVLDGVLTDLRIFENKSQLPQTSYQVVKAPNFASTDVSGADEWDLDTQMSSSMAGNVKLLHIYDASSLTDADLVMSYDRFKTDDIDKAASASYGECDSIASLAGSTTTDDAIFAQAAMQGQTVFASTGDTGSGCLNPAGNGVPYGVPGAEYPASSTYVIGVGGTSLFTQPNDFYQGEISWSAGGGNVSTVEKPGPWTAPVSTFATAGVRSVPDIAMDADPNVSGADIIVAGAPSIIGGTSLSSPLALGVWARLETQNANKFGFAGPVLYGEFGALTAAAPAPPAGYFTRTVGGFNDVLVGTNGTYAAMSGYDLTTGIGSFDIDKQLSYLKTLP